MSFLLARVQLRRAADDEALDYVVRGCASQEKTRPGFQYLIPIYLTL
jgi:hypothetical protein